MNVRQKTDHIVIHCADTPDDRDVDMATIKKWHVEERGWSDIGYHFVIRRNGLVEAGRDIKLSENRVEGYRNFATKLWNAARFCEFNKTEYCDRGM